MPYDPQNPLTLLQGNNLFDFMNGLNNAYRLKHGLPSGDPFRHDVGVCMKALSDANAELKRRPVVSVDCSMANHADCEGEEPAIWPDGDQTTRKCSCACHESKPQPLKTTYCWGCNAETRALRYYCDSWLCASCIEHLGSVSRG